MTVSSAGERAREILANPTFCIYPWIHLFAEPDGKVKPCCVSLASNLEDSQGVELALGRHSLGEIWDSEVFWQIRRKMLRGESIDGCEQCYHEERNDGISPRIRANLEWLQEHPERETWLRRVLAPAAPGEVLGPPVYFDLRLGNRCNLKCRMCTPTYSSSIANDPVHSRWEYAWGAQPPPEIAPGAELGLESEILAHLDQVRHLYFAGGEPLLDPRVRGLLERLIEAGVTERVRLSFSSNLTVLPKGFLRTLERFQRVTFMVSLEAHGAEFEYIRYPAKWRIVDRNFRELVGCERIASIVLVTAQIYNILSLVPLMEYCRDLQVLLSVNLLYSPPYLSVRELPMEVKQEAARRLWDYLGQEGSRRFLDVPSVLGLLDEMTLEPLLPEGEGMREFVHFTNDLDASRKQSFQASFPQLERLLSKSGVHVHEDKAEHRAGEREPR